MQRLYYRSIFLACLLLPATFLLSQNLIPNPGFEDGVADDFDNWSKLNGADYLVATTEPDEVYAGDRALKVTGQPANPGQQWQVQLITDGVPTSVGNTYVFTIWAKAASEGGNIRFSTQPNALYSQDFTVPSDDWTQLSWSFTANETLTQIALDLGQTDVTFYLDEAEMLAPNDPCVDEYDAPDDQEPIAAGKGKFIGSVYGGAQSVDHEHYFNQVTPENAGKWGSVEAERGVYDFSGIDTIRAYAARNNFPFRYHVLLWGNQQPAWLRPLTDEEKVASIRAWFAAVADHFDGSSDARATLEYLEVVNEFVNDPPNGLDNSPFSNNSEDANSGDYVNALKSLNAELGTTPGDYDWIVNAFKLAREYFPCEETKLMLNEYNVLTNDRGVTDEYLFVVDLLQAEGLIDVLGFQGHAFSTRKYGDGTFADNTAFLRGNVDRLAATGLPLQVTELDIDGNVDDTYTPTDDVAVRDSFQRAEYERVFGLLWNHPAVTGITLWGFRTGHWRSEQLAYLIDPCTDIPRPALAEYLNDSIRRADAPPLNEFASTCNTTSIVGGPQGLQTELSLFPNPAGRLITLQLAVAQPDAEVRVYDQLGKEITRRRLNEGQRSLDLNLDVLGITNGVYVLTVRSGARQSSLRFVVNR